MAAATRAWSTINMASVVLAPVSMLPLIPLASHLWGWFLAGFLSVLGWLIGAQIAFFLARRYGKPFVKRIISIEKLHKLEQQIPEEHLFWTVVFLRMCVSVDLLSYALGLFSNMKNGSYMLATFLGITPFAFIFAYTGTLSGNYQIVIVIVASCLGAAWYLTRKRKSEKNT